MLACPGARASLSALALSFRKLRQTFGSLFLSNLARALDCKDRGD